MISNLLNNAAKYTDEGGQIRLDAAVDNGVVTIRVRDTGLGVDPDLLPHVFDLFTQAERTPDRSEGGLGIGLTLVKRLVELHGGTVEARSEGLGSGAEFIVRLPVLRDARAGAAAGRFRIAFPSRQPADARSLRILVVDDNVDAADSIAMLLNMEGHETRSVNTARAALLAVPDFQPEVVLLDIGLPEMDGYEVARRLRAQNGTAPHAARRGDRLWPTCGSPARAGGGLRRAHGEARGADGAAGFPALGAVRESLACAAAVMRDSCWYARQPAGKLPRCP